MIYIYTKNTGVYQCKALGIKKSIFSLVSIMGKKMKKRVHVSGKSEIEGAFDSLPLAQEEFHLDYTRNFLLGLYITMIGPCDDPTYLLLQVVQKY
jgi:hypothetical protein